MDKDYLGVFYQKKYLERINEGKSFLIKKDKGYLEIPLQRIGNDVVPFGYGSYKTKRARYHIVMRAKEQLIYKSVISTSLGLSTIFSNCQGNSITGYIFNRYGKI
jgi:hypothetical protein